MGLVAITAADFDVEFDLRYATAENFTGRPVYARADCWLHADAVGPLREAIRLAATLDLRFVIYDALRPAEAQRVLWNHTPDPGFLADPRRGSPHSRGVAVDLCLIDGNRTALPMGTEFDEFSPRSHHGNTDIPVAAQRNRHLLMGLMTTAGWDFYRNEWWHYQLFDARAKWPRIWSDPDLPRPMMPETP